MCLFIYGGGARGEGSYRGTVGLLRAIPPEEDFPTQLLHRIQVPLHYLFCRTGWPRVAPGPAPLGHGERTPCPRWLHRPFAVWPWQVWKLQEPQPPALGSGDSWPPCGECRPEGRRCLSGSWTLKAGGPALTWYCCGCLAPVRTQHTVTSLPSRPLGSQTLVTYRFEAPNYTSRCPSGIGAGRGWHLVSLSAQPEPSEAWQPRFPSAVPEVTEWRAAPVVPFPATAVLSLAWPRERLVGPGHALGQRGVGADTVVT